MAVSGKVENKKRIGLWTTYHVTGKKATEILFKENKPLVQNTWDQEGNFMVLNGNGIHRDYSQETNRVIQYGSYIDGLKDGDWKIFYGEDGQPLLESFFKKGKLYGDHFTYYSSGQEQIKGYYENDQIVGNMIWYFEDGTIETVANFISGKKEGEQLFYNQEGLLIKKEIYKSGKLTDTVL